MPDKIWLFLEFQLWPETGHFSIMKKSWDLKIVLSNLEAEGQGRGIIKWVTTCLLLIGPFYTIKTNFMYYFAHDCNQLFEVEFFYKFDWLILFVFFFSKKIIENVWMNSNILGFPHCWNCQLSILLGSKKSPPTTIQLWSPSISRN